MRRPASALAVAALGAALATPAPARAGGWRLGDHATRGDGTKATRPREVPDFKAVRLEGSLDVRVTVGVPRSAAVTIDENLHSLVVTRLEGDTLVIQTGAISYRGEGRIDLSTPSLRALSIEGSGDVTVEGGRGDQAFTISGSGDLAWRGEAGRLSVDVQGSGNARLTGRAEAATVSVDGSGDVRGPGLTTRSAEVEVSGSGSVELTLDGGSLRARVDGSGDVVWHGRAQVERADVSGSGAIVRR